MDLSFTIAASAVILRSKSRGTHGHILLSQIRDSPNLDGQVAVFISPKNRVARLYPQALGSHFVASYDSVENMFIVVLQRFPWQHVCLRRRYLVTPMYSCLLRICGLAADVVSLFVSRSLPSNGYTRHNILWDCTNFWPSGQPNRPGDYHLKINQQLENCKRPDPRRPTYEMKSDQEKANHVKQRKSLCGLLYGAVGNSECIAYNSRKNSEEWTANNLEGSGSC
jgi:hypothetical protein